MGAKTEALAKQLEAKAREAVATLEKLTEADWTKVTAGEKWPVGVTAHHVSGALEPVSQMIRAVVAGQPGNVTRAMIDGWNAKHAQDYANCTKAETIDFLKRGAATAAEVIRGLSDEQLAKSGTALVDLPPMTAEQLIFSGLINHLDEHFGSIRQTVGH